MDFKRVNLRRFSLINGFKSGKKVAWPASAAQATPGESTTKDQLVATPLLLFLDRSLRIYQNLLCHLLRNDIVVVHLHVVVALALGH